MNGEVKTAREVAAHLGIKEMSVRRLARVRGIGHKLADVWVFTADDVAALEAIDRQGGWHEHRQQREGKASAGG